MQDKYLLPLNERQHIVSEQIGECQRLIYRNDLENITFKKKGDEDKMIEVEANNNILKRKIDGLYEELERLKLEAES